MVFPSGSGSEPVSGVADLSEGDPLGDRQYLKSQGKVGSFPTD